MKKRCPRCGSSQTAPILYGMPAFDEEMEAKLNAKQIYLGGCCIGQEQPGRHCFECELDFHTPPRIVSEKHGVESLPDIVTGLEFEIGGFFGGYKKLSIGKVRNKYILTVCPNIYEQGENYTRAISKEEWEALRRRLFEETYLHEWGRHYSNEALDGEQWELTLKLTYRRKRRYTGSNVYPPLWADFLKLLRPYFEEAGEELCSIGESREDHSLKEMRRELAGRMAEYFMLMED